MCGIIGLVGRRGESLSISPAQMERMRDTMTQRGPDGQGLIQREHVLFGHRMLSILDPGNCPQPIQSADGRYLLTYNGELYNDAEIRKALAEHGVTFKTNCDTETLFAALVTQGASVIPMLRGMFAFAFYDFAENTLLLARDHLGIKPLYFVNLGDEVLFASHIPALLEHPGVSRRPDMATVSSYLSTIRTTLGSRTLFSDISTLRPGEVVIVRDVDHADLEVRRELYWNDPAPVNLDEATVTQLAETVANTVCSSVLSHLRSDVSRCTLLSGGLDSAIMSAVVSQSDAVDAMRTWCAADEEDGGGDREHARLVADRLGCLHHNVVITEDLFHDNWAHLIETNALPLSTPNETAIYAVAKDLSQHATVALSGEGADELFAGYAAPMLSGLDHSRLTTPSDAWPGSPGSHARFVEEITSQYGDSDLGTPVDHYLRCNSWVHPANKGVIFNKDITDALDNDAALYVELALQFSLDDAGVNDMERLLRVHRRMNLTGLLRRLDTSTMAAGVEGRTPFADLVVADLAMQIPLEHKLRIDGPETDESDGWSSSLSLMTRQKVQTKAILRRAFAKSLPRVVIDRPKASFPLPFQSWIARDAASAISDSPLAEWVRPEILAGVEADPAACWQIAWPLLNLALWSRRWAA